MRVFYISAYAPIPNTHAGGQRVYRMISGLSRNHDVTLLTCIDDESERPQLSHIAKHCKEVIPVLRTRYTHAYDPWSVRPHWLEVEFNSSEMKERVREAAFSGNYDVLQFEYLQTSMFAPERSPVPMIITHHEVQSLALERKMRMLPRRSFKWFGLYRQYLQMFRYEMTKLPRFDRVIVLTNEEDAYLRQYIPSLPTAINTMGVDCEFFQPLNGTEKQNSLAYVAYFRHEPNVDAAFRLVNEIMPLVSKSVPDICLYLVGGHPPEEIKAKCNNFKVKVTGWVQDIRPFLGQCSVFVAPIRLGAGMRGKILEAWAMARPIVCTKVAAAGIRSTHGENIMIADSNEDFAETICHLLENSSLRRRIGNAGLQTVRKYYDWELLIKQQDNLYRELVQS